MAGRAPRRLHDPACRARRSVDRGAFVEGRGHRRDAGFRRARRQFRRVVLHRHASDCPPLSWRRESVPGDHVAVSSADAARGGPREAWPVRRGLGIGRAGAAEDLHHADLLRLGPASSREHGRARERMVEGREHPAARGSSGGGVWPLRSRCSGTRNDHPAVCEWMTRLIKCHNSVPLIRHTGIIVHFGWTVSMISTHDALANEEILSAASRRIPVAGGAGRQPLYAMAVEASNLARRHASCLSGSSPRHGYRQRVRNDRDG